MQLPFLCSIPASFPAFSSSKPYFCCQRFLKFSSYRKMNRNRNRGGYSRWRASPFTGESSRRDECDESKIPDAFSDGKNVSSYVKRLTLSERQPDGRPKLLEDDNFQHLECHSQVDSANKSKWPSLSCSGVNDRPLHERRSQHLETPRERSPTVDFSVQDNSSHHPEYHSVLDSADKNKWPSLSRSGVNDRPLHERRSQHLETPRERSPMVDFSVQDNSSHHPEYHSVLDSADKNKWPSLSCSSVNDRSLHERGRQHLETPRERSPVVDFVSLQDESPPFPHSAKDRMYKQPITERCGKAQTSPVKSVVNSSSGCSGFSLLERFDICQSKKGTAIRLKAPLHIKNREKRREGAGQLKDIRRPGMVLLKNFISHNDQINIVKRCRDLGVGTGGFYQPAYRDGSRMHLQMMCLGKNWDPETRIYGNQRSIDGAEPPSIPEEFKRLVKEAIQACHAVIKQESKVKNVEEVLPGMNPDVCIVNFYSTTGRLGLHQDCDESSESLQDGLPVVSFSIGDTAEFLYGDGRDIEEADKIILESGDVLVFGGQARHVFHGVQSIHPDSAPKMLVEEAELRPGRLNLTFRRY